MTQFIIPDGADNVILGYIRRKSVEWTTAQMIDRVSEALDQLETAARAVREADLERTAPGEEWSPLFCIRHVAEINMNTAGRCASVAATGMLPDGGPPPLPPGREGILEAHGQWLRSALDRVARDEQPEFATVTWTHPLLGELNWREWFLTLRVHCLGHTGQIAGMAAALAAEA